MSSSLYTAALSTLLTTDATFIAAINAAMLGTTHAPAVPKVLEGNRSWESIGQEHYPCWMIDDGDSRGGGGDNEGGDPDGLTIGSHHQDWVDSIDLALVWHQQDFAVALQQRRAVKQAVVRLLLRNPDLAADANMAYVVEVFNDRSYRHPAHVMLFRVRVHSTIERDGP